MGYEQQCNQHGLVCFRVRMRRYLVSYTTLATRAVTLLPLRWLAAWIRRYSSRREPTALRSRSTSTRG